MENPCFLSLDPYKIKRRKIQSSTRCGWEKVVDSVEAVTIDGQEDNPPTNTSLRDIHGYGAGGKLPDDYVDRAASDLPYGYAIWPVN
jgi:hypothetical protein